jgi:hypothetical protein
MSKNNGLDSLKQAQQARAASLSKWRASRMHEETLPSGLEVLLRDVDIMNVVIDGNIPNTLIDVIGGEGFQSLSEEEIGKKMLEEHKGDFNALMRQLITASLVEPAIGETADDKHILYGELSFEDKMHIFNFLNRDSQAVRSFRDKSAKPDPAA